MNNICVFDFETDSVDPETCSPVQLSSVMINSQSLEIIEDSVFNGYMKPPDINDEDYRSKHEDTIKWHADLQKTTVNDIIEKWKRYSNQKVIWKQFVDYVDQYNINQSKKSIFNAPNPAGYNIINFDMIIINRLCKKYGPVKNNKQNLFFDRDIRDVMHISSYWLDSVKDIKTYNFDALRSYFGMSFTDAHNALQDCRQTAALLIKYLELAKRLTPNIQFKGSFVNK